jgi:hypothetical protein
LIEFSPASAASADGLSAAAQAIVQLINSQPRTPNAGEIRGVLERCLEWASGYDPADGTSIASHAETWRKLHAAADMSRAVVDYFDHCVHAQASDAIEKAQAAEKSETALREKLWELPATSPADVDLLAEICFAQLWPGRALFSEDACVLHQDAAYWDGEDCGAPLHTS